MLEIYEDHKKYYSEVVEFATKVGALEELNKSLEWMRTYACRGENDVIYETRSKFVLYKDVAPNSVQVRVYKRKNNAKVDGPPEITGRRAIEIPEPEYEFWYNGGLIYSGPGLPADGSFPSLSVSLDPDANSGKRHMWSVHT